MYNTDLSGDFCFKGVGSMYANYLEFFMGNVIFYITYLFIQLFILGVNSQVYNLYCDL